MERICEYEIYPLSKQYTLTQAELKKLKETYSVIFDININQTEINITVNKYAHFSNILPELKVKEIFGEIEYFIMYRIKKKKIYQDIGDLGYWNSGYWRFRILEIWYSGNWDLGNRNLGNSPVWKIIIWKIEFEKSTFRKIALRKLFDKGKILDTSSSKPYLFINRLIGVYKWFNLYNYVYI
ncbi:hypothetical protein RCL_jg22437.t1 [Rhizophagus clarus]|uniref:Uncharacterized protein n=1 Tax=Rhizophagus clarus TaxID=94130 RepID=A0A8H3MFC2_9GLOM|nr:hypothetical protein RCL_jg22437.t1 [Rhizophagus clarus]